jgi:hypothetical protein
MIPPVPTDIKKRLVEEALRIFFEVREVSRQRSVRSDAAIDMKASRIMTAP